MLEPTEDPNVFINKLTKRKVKKGSQQYCKIMMEQNEKNGQSESTQSDETPPPSRKKIQKKTKKVLTTIAKENKSKLEKSKDVEGELRKLLYEKLCMTESKPPKHVPKHVFKAASFKKKNRRTPKNDCEAASFKAVINKKSHYQQYPSSSSSSDSESSDTLSESESD